MKNKNEFVYLIRHARAEPRGAKPDAERALTEEGILRFQKALPALRRKLGTGLLILTSPLVRARETAALLAEALESPVEEESWIAEGDGSGLDEAQRRGHSIAVVGHEPYLSEWIEERTGEWITVKKGSVTCLRPVPEEERWELVWNATVKELAEDDA